MTSTGERLTLSSSAEMRVRDRPLCLCESTREPVGERYRPVWSAPAPPRRTNVPRDRTQPGIALADVRVVDETRRSLNTCQMAMEPTISGVLLSSVCADAGEAVLDQGSIRAPAAQ